MKHRKKKIALLVFLAIIAAGFVIPEDIKIPVEGASQNDWNKDSFWYEPWGKSGVHKGIDIFAAKGTKLFSSSNGLVLYSGTLARGGKVVVVLGPKWRVHYYAHLDSIHTDMLSLVTPDTLIGTVGDTGNAKTTPPHLHYSIVTLIPNPFRIDSSTQGWKKMLYLDPGKLLLEP